MKRVLLVLLLALLGLLYVYRQRIYLCDPLAKVYKSAPRQRGISAPLESRKSASTRGGKSNPLKPTSQPEVESNTSPTVITDNRYGVITEHPQNNSTNLGQNSAAGNLAGLQNGVSNVQQSGRAVLNLGDKADQAISNLLADDHKKDRQSGVQVFVNLSGNVLLERDTDSETDLILLQSWNQSAGTPTSLTCVHWLFCFTNADHATTNPLDWIGNTGRGKGRFDPHLAMTGRSVSFVDGTGSVIRVDLR